MVHRCRSPAVSPLGRWIPLRLVAISGQSRLGVGDRAVPDVLAVGVSAVQAGVQAYRPKPADPRRVQPERWQRTHRRRNPLPGHVHSGRPSGPPVLGGEAMRRIALAVTLLLMAASWLVPAADAARKLRVVTTIPDLKS